MDKIIKGIKEFKEKYGTMPEGRKTREVNREEFTLLLSGISTCRKTPGIPVHMGYESLYHCDNEEDSRQVLGHMERLFGVKDKDTLMKACYGMYSGSGEYEQFMTFWKGAPLFDVKELTKEGYEGFLQCKRLAEQFYPVVKEKGFYAWDINERIGLCRNAVACGMLSEEEFWQITDVWVRQAQVFYHSYGEYAVSCLCGAVYQMGRYDSDIGDFFAINKNVIEHLLEENGAWQRNRWYNPKEREWADLLGGSNPGCFVTKRALEEQIGYMYRDEPNPDYPDSGWRFFVGDEPDAYVNDPDNTTVCGLNTICNLYPDILAYIHAETGRSFGRHAGEWEDEGVLF